MKFLIATFALLLSPFAWADIVIGQSAPLSGSNAELGKDIRSGALAYFKKVNDAGGVNGQQIRLVTLDDKNDAPQSGINTKTLVNENNVVALFGYASSTLSIPAMPTVVEKKVPFFAPFTGADAIRKQNDFVYTVRATYADEIEKIISFWGKLGVTKITVLHYDDTVGKENFASVTRVLEKFGKKPVSVAIKRNTDLTDSTVQEIIASDPQVLLVTTLYAPASQMVKKLKALNKPYSVASLSFAGASQLAKSLGADSAGITVALTVPTPKNTSMSLVKECAAAWTTAANTEPMSVTALEACMAAKVLVEGLKKAGKPVTRESLQAALSSLTRIDVGGFDLSFKPGFHHGGSFVDVAVISKTGELRN